MTPEVSYQRLVRLLESRGYHPPASAAAIRGLLTPGHRSIT